MVLECSICAEQEKSPPDLTFALKKGSGLLVSQITQDECETTGGEEVARRS